MTVKLTREETQAVLLLLLAEEGRLHRAAIKYREEGQPGVADSLQRGHDAIMALRKKFQPKERESTCRGARG